MMNKLTRLLVKALEAELSGKRGVLVEGSSILWNGFMLLSRCRSIGPVGPNPISMQEIEAWSRLMRVPLEPSHVEAICEMDAVWLRHFQKRQTHQASGKIIPARAQGNMSASLFDAMF